MTRMWAKILRVNQKSHIAITQDGKYVLVPKTFALEGISAGDVIEFTPGAVNADPNPDRPDMKCTWFARDPQIVAVSFMTLRREAQRVGQ